MDGRGLAFPGAYSDKPDLAAEDACAGQSVQSTPLEYRNFQYENNLGTCRTHP